MMPTDVDPGILSDGAGQMFLGILFVITLVNTLNGIANIFPAGTEASGRAIWKAGAFGAASLILYHLLQAGAL